MDSSGVRRAPEKASLANKLKRLPKLCRTIGAVPETTAVMSALLRGALDLSGASSGFAGVVTGATAAVEVPAECKCLKLRSDLMDVLSAGTQVRTSSVSERGPAGSVLLAPVGRDSAPLGFIELREPPGPGFSASDIQLLDVLCEAAAAALQHARSELALRGSEHRFRTLMEKSADGFVLLSPTGCVLHNGPPVLGYSADHWVGRSVLDALHPDDRDQTFRLFKRVLHELARPVTGQFRCRHANGSWRIVEASARNLLREPAVEAIVVNYRDVTERERLQQQFLQAQKMEAIGAVAGGVAHDFNNLLMIICGYCQLLQDQVGDNANWKSSLDEILKAANHATALTRQLLAFSRRATSETKIVDLNHLVSNMERMLGRVIGEHIQLLTDLAPGLGQVKVDAGQMEQVLLNLAVNARDAMPHGGCLRIETRNVELNDLSHPAVTPGPYVLLSVLDSGHGMPREVRERLFEPFFTTKEKGKGTGLGLCTVYGIVKQNHGDISVWSEPEHGACFQIYLPRLERGERQVAPDLLPTRAHRNETILLVEDEEGVRQIAGEMLRRGGYSVLEASDGRAALEIYDRSGDAIDLVLTDVVMPLMSGRELMERIRAVRPGAPILYMSGYTDDVIAYHGLGSGIGLLQKPFTGETLMRKIRETLEQARCEAETA